MLILSISLVLSIQTELGYDLGNVYDGFTGCYTAATQVDDFSGAVDPGVYFYQADRITISFTSDVSYTEKGFHMGISIGASGMNLKKSFFCKSFSQT